MTRSTPVANGRDYPGGLRPGAVVRLTVRRSDAAGQTLGRVVGRYGGTDALAVLFTRGGVVAVPAAQLERVDT